MVRSRRYALVSQLPIGSGHCRHRQRVLVVRRSTSWLRKASQKRMPVRIRIKNAAFDDGSRPSKISNLSSKRLRKILCTMERRRFAGKVIVHLPRNRTTRKIPYSAWIDMLDDLRPWAPTLTLRILTSAHLATFPLVVKYTDVIKLRADGSEIDLASVIWHLRKFPTTAGFKCTIVFG
jgi:hypothetical protein